MENFFWWFWLKECWDVNEDLLFAVLQRVSRLLHALPSQYFYSPAFKAYVFSSQCAFRVRWSVFLTKLRPVAAPAGRVRTSLLLEVIIRDFLLRASDCKFNYFWTWETTPRQRVVSKNLLYIGINDDNMCFTCKYQMPMSYNVEPACDPTSYKPRSIYVVCSYY